MFDDIRLAFYLIPPYRLCSEILRMRQIVQDQYRLSAALNFMIHMTIKGFFKPASAIDRNKLAKDLDELVSNYGLFKIYPDGLKILHADHSLVVNFPRERNEILWSIQRDCFESVESYISPNCDFTARENDRFDPHITVTMMDAPIETLEDIREYLRDAALRRSGYTVRNFNLYEFKSNAWGTSEWIHSLSWELLHSWFLKP